MPQGIAGFRFSGEWESGIGNGEWGIEKALTLASSPSVKIGACEKQRERALADSPFPIPHSRLLQSRSR
jgi:hypothetical protein